MVSRALVESFDPEWASPSEWASMYRALAIQVVPSRHPAAGAQWKIPALEWKEFQDRLVPDPMFARWYGPQGGHAKRKNMGLITGRASGNLFVIDLDEYKSPAALAWWRGVLAEHNNSIEPETCQQTTGGGGRQLLFRGAPNWTAPTNRTSLSVDVRGQGGFAVLPPSQHDSGKSYSWKLGFAPWECEIADAPAWLMAAVDKLVLEHGGDKERGSVGPTERTASPPDDVNAFGLREDGREEYMRDLIWASVLDWYRECPIKPDTQSSSHRMAEAFAVYERKTKSRLPGTEPNAERLEREGRGITLFTDKWRRALAQWDSEVAEEVAKDPAPPPPQIDPATGEPLPLVLSAAQFVAGFTPPEYLVDGVMQRGYLYSLTARTGHGKTAVSMYLAQCVARGQKFHHVDVKQGTVLLLAGENPDDIRARFLVLSEAWGFVAESLKMKFVAGVVDVAASMPIIRAEAETIGDLVLVIVDTAAAYFKGDDSNSNAQQGDYARLLRQITFLPGKPAVLVNCHPIKNASKENLLPMGGSAFLNEVDGNLTLWANSEKQTTLHWLGKFRGPEFEPLTFEMKTAESMRVVNSSGEMMPSVVAEPVSEIRLQMAEDLQDKDEVKLLNAIARNPRASTAMLAVVCGFTNDKLQPLKAKVFRLGQRLEEDKLVERVRRKLRVTAKGKKEIGWEDE